MRNVLAVAWSEDGLLAYVTRAAYRGPKNQVHVVDAANGFAPVAKMDLEGAPDRETACLVFAGERLVAHAGTDVVSWDPRTGKELDRCRFEGWVFELYDDGHAGVNANGALRLVHLESGADKRLWFSADWLDPLVGPTGDWAVIDDGKVQRVGIDGAVRWEAPMPKHPHAFAAHATAVAIGNSQEKRVYVFSAEDGHATTTIATTDQIHGTGVLADGTLWILEWHGRLAFHRPNGELVRETKIDALCRSATLSPSESTIAIVADLLELRSSLRVVSTATGELLWESKAQAKKPPTARATGATLTAKDGKLWKKGVAEALGTYTGDVAIAIAKDGSLALVVDERGVRVFDVAIGKKTIELSSAKVEEETIDVVDAPLFDADHRPLVKVGRHTFLVTADGVVATKATKPKAKKKN